MWTRSTLTWVLVSVIVGAVLGAGISYAIVQPMIARLESSNVILESRIGSLSSSLAALEIRLDALNSSQQGLGPRIDALNSSQASQGTKLEILNATQVGLSNSIAALNASQIGLSNSFNATKIALNNSLAALNSSQITLNNSFTILNTSLTEVETDLSSHLNQSWHVAYSSPTLSSADGVYTTPSFDTEGPVRLLWSFEANSTGSWLWIEIRYWTSGTVLATRAISGIYDKDTSDIIDMQPGTYYMVLTPSLNVTSYYVNVNHRY